MSDDVDGDAVRRLHSVESPEVADQLGMDERVVEDDARHVEFDAAAGSRLTIELWAK